MRTGLARYLRAGIASETTIWPHRAVLARDTRCSQQSPGRHMALPQKERELEKKKGQNVKWKRGSLCICAPKKSIDL